MRVITFGEVMIRLVPPDFLRLRQSLPGHLEATFGGGELNVAVSIAFQGGRSAFLTVLPDNPLTDAFEQELRKMGVETSLLQRSPHGRFGIYFVEMGANQRASTVTYDRNGSSIALTPASRYEWSEIFQDADWFHITGITPAISVHSAEASLQAVRAAKQAGLKVSCDLNFRKKLWNWQPEVASQHLAGEIMRQLLASVDVVIANEEDAEKVLSIKAPETEVEAGRLNIKGYQHVARTIRDQFPQVKQVAITLRESYSASHNNWGAMLFDAASDHVYLAPLDSRGNYTPYEIRNIVDRVGAGDSFAGALIYALTTPELSAPETALKYATAASCLKHSILGDFNYSTRAEIEALMKGSGSGRVLR